MINMPSEALLEVLAFLNYESLVAIRMTNAKFNEMVARNISKLARLQLKRINIR
jgi:hypothetical protein